MALKRTHLLTAAAITAVCCGIYYLLDHFLDGSVWSGMTLSQTVAKQEYCEYSDMDAFLRQCMNSYSNLAFFFFGVVLLLTAQNDRKHRHNDNPVAGFPALTFLCGISLIYLCFGSTFFHASLTWPGQRVDMNGTYSVCIIMILLSLYRLFYTTIDMRQLRAGVLLVFFILVPVYVYLHLLVPGIYLLPLMMLIVTVLTIVNIRRHPGLDQYRYAVISLCCLTGAAVFRQLDTAKIGCNPHSLWQGHSAWHVLIGASPFFLYFFYRSEKTAA